MISLTKKTADAPCRGFVSEALDEVLTQPGAQYPHHYISPSRITECSKLLVCELCGLIDQEVPSAQLRRIMDNGIFTHQRYTSNYLMKTNLVLSINDLKSGKQRPFSEVSIINTDLLMKGSPDAVIINPKTGAPYVFELKTVNTNAFKKLSSPEPAHVMQVHCYMYMLGVGQSIVLYEDKNDQSLKEFVVAWSQPIFDSVLLKVNAIKAGVEEYKASRTISMRCDSTRYGVCRCSQVRLA